MVFGPFTIFVLIRNKIASNIASTMDEISFHDLQKTDQKAQISLHL